MKINLKNYTPHLAAVASFLALSLVYFLPMLKGMQVQQHDIMQWTGMSKEIVDFREKYHTEPLWTNSMFGGMPAYQVSVIYSGNLLRFVDRILSFFLPAPMCYLFLMLVGFYLLLLSLCMDFRLSMVGAIAFAFSAYHAVVITAGHNSKAHAIAYMPLVIAGILMVFRGRMLAGTLITAAALSIQVYANHFQITYYLFMLVTGLIIAELIKSIRSKTLKSFFQSSALLAIAALFAVLTNITNLWATYEYGKYSTRSQSELAEKKVSTGLDKDYALQYSYAPAESFIMLIPRYSGGASVESLGKSSETFKVLRDAGVPENAALGFVDRFPLYFGDLYSTSGSPYAGAVIVFFFVLGLMVVRSEIKWWLAALTLLSLMLSWGRNFMPLTDLFFDHFPGYNKFRAVSMTLVIAEFCIPLLAMLALQKITDGSMKKADILKKLKLAFYITGGFCLITVLIPGLFLDFSAASDKEYLEYFKKNNFPNPDSIISAFHTDRAMAVRMDALRSLIFIAAAFGMLWLYLQNKIKKISNLWFGLILLVLVDLWMVSKRYLNDNNFVKKSKAEKPFTLTEADQQILLDTDPDFRVMNTTVSTFNDASTSYYHKSIGGYHGAKLQRYQELIEYQISNNNRNVLNMLNTKYFIFQPQQNAPPVAQRNPDACGHAWFVSEIKWVANADSEMHALTDFNPLHTAFIDERFKATVTGFNPQPDSAATIRLTSYLPNKLNYETECQSDQFAVFSEIYYDKGWNAYVDGNLTPHVRVNYVLRGMKIPAGKHQVEFRFEPSVYSTGEKISYASSALLLLLLAGMMVMELRKSRQS